jgi:hypothetical protein
LTVRDCLDGLVQAIRHGFFDLDTFNVEEYEHFEQVEVSAFTNGIVGIILVELVFILLTL